jgi:hypothetical protein
MANNFPTIRPSLNMNFAGTGVLPPDVTFTRASSSGGYYDGVTVSKAEENLFTNSGAGATNWIVLGGGGKTATTVTGVTTADGAYLIRGTATNSGEVYTVSLELSGTGVIRFSALTPGGSVTGSIDVTLTATPTRYSITHTAAATGASAGMTLTGVDGTSVTATVNNMQFELRAFATAYTPTTTQPITNYIPKMLFAPANVPVFDHNPTTGEALGLSVWEARTNLLQRSQEFDDAYWTKTRSSISADQIIAPDGTLTADKLVEDTSTNTHVLQRSISLGGSVDSSAYTISFYVKASERSFLQAYDNGQNASGSTVFDLSTGAVTSGTGTITSVGNGWYKCAIYPLKNFGTTAILVFVLQSDAGTSSYLGDGTSGIYIWGAQLEAGAFATPYIPTVASTVARSADVAVMTGVNFSRWYRTDEGSFVLEGAAAGSSSGALISIAEGALADNRILITLPAPSISGNILFAVANGLTQVALNGTPTTSTANKVAGSYAVNDYKACLNGGTVGTDTTALVPVVDNLRLGQTVGTVFSGYYKSIQYYPIALTSAQLQAVTA